MSKTKANPTTEPISNILTEIREYNEITKQELDAIKGERKNIQRTTTNIGNEKYSKGGRHKNGGVR